MDKNRLNQIIDSFTPAELELVHYIVGASMTSLPHLGHTPLIQAVTAKFTEEQREALTYSVDEAVKFNKRTHG